ncbi:hypothetical protein [Myceligenerans crystallogenes]|uniref:hypothetical protein n=1 Tax=Myceligenerans crystallogenes TaxID=316335 RepID=UPI0031DA083F
MRASQVAASPEVVWAAVLLQVEVLGPDRYVRLMGCRDRGRGGPRPLAAGSLVPGFRVDGAMPPQVLVLDGAHRFSAYRLTFRLLPGADGGTRLEAHTDAVFPGVLGTVYRLLVFDSRLHKLATWSIVRRVRRRADRMARRGLPA